MQSLSQFTGGGEKENKLITDQTYSISGSLWLSGWKRFIRIEIKVNGYVQ